MSKMAKNAIRHGKQLLYCLVAKIFPRFVQCNYGFENFIFSFKLIYSYTISSQITVPTDKSCKGNLFLNNNE